MGCGCSSTETACQSQEKTPKTPAEPLSPEMATAFTDLFGDKLQSKSGEITIEAALAGKEAIGIYFSAHWCPPCKGFTPQLAKAYNNSLRSKGLEVIFVSSDRSEKEFENYHKEMPWLAVPYSRRDVHEALSKKFKVRGIPTFVILDKTGQVLTADGRSKVSSDPNGQSFPWKPKTFREVMGNSFRKGDALVGEEAIAGKTLGIYFSAHWCPPCRGFTPTLAKQYKTYKEEGLPFEVVFCTGDRDEASFDSYYKEMLVEGGDWLAMPWSSSAQRQELNSLFEVSGIPCLVIVDENGNIINKNASGAVASDPLGENFPWAPPAVGNLANPEGIDEAVSVCVFMETVDADLQKTICSEMDQVAKRCIDAGRSKGQDPAYRFFAAKTGEGAVPQIRNICGLPKDAPQGQPIMLLLDLSDNGAFYASKHSEISVSTIGALMKAYEEKSITRLQMSK